MLQIRTPRALRSVRTRTAQCSHKDATVFAQGRHSVRIMTAQCSHKDSTVFAQGRHSVRTSTAQCSHKDATVFAKDSTVFAQGRHKHGTVFAQARHSVRTRTALVAPASFVFLKHNVVTCHAAKKRASACCTKHSCNCEKDCEKDLITRTGIFESSQTYHAS